jgi:hypothetical protein
MLLSRGFPERLNRESKAIGWQVEISVDGETLVAAPGSNKRMQRRPRSEFVMVP